MARLVQMRGRWMTGDQIRGGKQWQGIRDRRNAAADGQPCPRCHRTMIRGHADRGRWPTTDHTIPIENGGGPFDSANLATLCLRCNSSKSNRVTHPMNLHVAEW